MKNSIYIKPRLFGWLFMVAVFVEIASFIIVGRMIGVFATLALLVLGMFVGIILLRLQGLNLLSSMQRELAAGRVPSGQIADRALMIIAAILLIIPGFVSDIIGLLLFLAPIRGIIWRFFTHKFKANFSTYSNNSYDAPHNQQHKSQKDKIIDLDSADYHNEKDNNSKNINDRKNNNDSPWKQ